MLKIFVEGKKSVEPLRKQQPKQFPVCNPAPTLLTDPGDLKLGEFFLEPARKILVKQ
jgi:hypothetical protein